MKVVSYAVVSMVMLSALSAYAQTTGSADDSNPNSDILNNIPIYSHPTDYGTSQELAVQNRLDRIAMLQKSVTCIQQATDQKGINACLVEEGETLDKIRLSYCATNVAFPYSSLKGSNKESDKEDDKMTDASTTPQPETTECAAALANYKKLSKFWRGAKATSTTP